MIYNMRSWQDIVLAVSFFAFNIALIPSVLGKQKPRLATSVLTTLFLIPGLIVYSSLNLWYSFVMTFINASLWATLAIQRTKQLKLKKVDRKY